MALKVGAVARIAPKWAKTRVIAHSDQMGRPALNWGWTSFPAAPQWSEHATTPVMECEIRFEYGLISLTTT
jgi:hypothetical protein